MKRLVLNADIGPLILNQIEHDTGEGDVHIILIAFPIDGDQLGEPAIVTSFDPEDAQQIIIKMGERLPQATKTVTGVHDTHPHLKPGRPH
jgi:hypothetical protein